MKQPKTGRDLLPFIGLVLACIILYAPYGINETDGGFISGLAWQVLQGKTLYADLVYVRPPIPVWLRALEMHWLPDTGAVLWERCLFYIKVGLYTWLAAALLAPRPYRTALAMAGLIISVHHYPAAAWHTVDGLLLAVAGFYALLAGKKAWTQALGGALVVAAMLCKQSFYPLAGVFLLLCWLQRREKQPWPALLGFSGALAAFYGYLYTRGLLPDYLVLTGGSAGIRDAIRHGLLDYVAVDMKWWLFTALTVPAGMVLYFRYRSKARVRPMLSALFVAWLAGLALLYAVAIYRNQAFTLPFGPVRLCFGVSAAYVGWAIWQKRLPHSLWVLLAIAWCSALSWGYNLPILLATPWVYVCASLAAPWWRERAPGWRWPVLALLFGLFFYANQFIYRDGKRADMRAHLGDVFPALYGIYSTADKAAMYADLKSITARYPGPFKTIPAFPQANFLTRTAPPLPLDWVVRREIGGADSLVWQAVQGKPIYYIILQSDLAVLRQGGDPELAFAKAILDGGRALAETPYFLVLKGE